MTIERVDVADGKYSVIHNNGVLTALRHGEPWDRDLTGDNLIYWMVQEILDLKAQKSDLLYELERAADTLDDLKKVSFLIGKPKMAEACGIAEESARKLISSINFKK